jgi:hypothetical protein
VVARTAVSRRAERWRGLQAEVVVQQQRAWR